MYNLCPFMVEKQRWERIEMPKKFEDCSLLPFDSNIAIG